MRAINHALTGTAIGLIIGQPLIALPLALASHFICDAIPHHGSSLPDHIVLRTKVFKNVLVFDALLCIVLVIGLAVLQPNQWLLAAVCAFVAASPDFLYINRFRAARARKKHRNGTFEQFTVSIQWFQKPIGLLVEVAWFAASIIVLAPFVA